MKLKFATAFPLRVTASHAQAWCAHFGLTFQSFALTPEGFEVDVAETITVAAQAQIAASLSAILSARLVTPLA